MKNIDPSRVLSRATATTLLHMVGDKGEMVVADAIGIARGTLARALAGLPMQRSVVALVVRWVNAEKGREAVR